MPPRPLRTSNRESDDENRAKTRDLRDRDPCRERDYSWGCLKGTGIAFELGSEVDLNGRCWITRHRFTLRDVLAHLPINRKELLVSKSLCYELAYTPKLILQLFH